jgi:hypothetical protein
MSDYQDYHKPSAAATGEIRQKWRDMLGRIGMLKRVQ